MWTSLFVFGFSIEYCLIIAEKARNFKYFAPFLEKITRFSLGITLWTNCGEKQVVHAGFFHGKRGGRRQKEKRGRKEKISTKQSTVWKK